MGRADRHGSKSIFCKARTRLATGKWCGKKLSGKEFRNTLLQSTAVVGWLLQVAREIYERAVGCRNFQNIGKASVLNFQNAVGRRDGR